MTWDGESVANAALLVRLVRADDEALGKRVDLIVQALWGMNTKEARVLLAMFTAIAEGGGGEFQVRQRAADLVKALRGTSET